MHVKTIKVIESSGWDKLVQEVYKKPYKFQQQEGCQDRGLVYIKIPNKSDEAGMNNNIPETLDTEKMGVKFKTWLKRDPKTPLKDDLNLEWVTQTFWERNFYPNLQTLANDLYDKGLIQAGEYYIKIDW